MHLKQSTRAKIQRNLHTSEELTERCDKRIKGSSLVMTEKRMQEPHSNHCRNSNPAYLRDKKLEKHQTLDKKLPATRPQKHLVKNQNEWDNDT